MATVNFAAALTVNAVTVLVPPDNVTVSRRLAAVPFELITAEVAVPAVAKILSFEPLVVVPVVPPDTLMVGAEVAVPYAKLALALRTVPSPIMPTVAPAAKPVTAVVPVERSDAKPVKPEKIDTSVDVMFTPAARRLICSMLVKLGAPKPAPVPDIVIFKVSTPAPPLITSADVKVCGAEAVASMNALKVSAADVPVNVSAPVVSDLSA